MPIVPPTRVSVTPLAPTDQGVMQTLGVMVGLIQASQSSETVVGQARLIVETSVPRWLAQSQFAMSRAVGVWLGRHFRFVPDPRDAELLRDAENMLATARGGFVVGDCDEAAVLGASLGLCLGINPTLQVLEFAGQPQPGYSHVYALLLPDDGHPVTLDVTRPAGVPTPTVLRSYTMPV